MNARRAARELALLTLFQMDNKGLPSVEESDKASLEEKYGIEDLIMTSVRALTEQANEQIEEAAKILEDTSNYISDQEFEHLDNLESPMDAPQKPVPLPTTKELQDKIEGCRKSVNNLTEALRIPEFAAHTQSVGVHEYALRLMSAVLEHRTELDESIEKYCDTWSLDRLVKIDRDILRLAMAEIRFIPDVDSSVSINEAVELAKQFSTEESHKFINGVLGNFVKDTDPSAA